MVSSRSPEAGFFSPRPVSRSGEESFTADAAGLRRWGIDVTTTREVGLQGADDSDHIAFALARRSGPRHA